jgi:Flp pilus assembly protein CpaB
MNRKLLPLLGIAFVVAVVATGVFYGLIVGRLRNATGGKPHRPLVVAARSLDPGAVLTKEDLRLSTWVGAEAPKDAVSAPEQVEGWTVIQAIGENEPLIRTRLASSKAGGGAALAIPAGMRAVSIQVPDSPGVLRLLRPGHKVDVQVIRSRGVRSGEGEIRTVLQAVEVLAVPDQKDARQTAAAVLTVLAKPSDAEVLSLADAGARLRVVLRNPLDQEAPSLRGGDVSALFRESPPVSRPAVSQASRVESRPALAVSGPRVRFDVRIVGAGPAAVRELESHLVGARPRGEIHVTAFRAHRDLEQVLERLQAHRQLEVLSISSLVTANTLPLGIQAGAAACGIRVHLSPSTGPSGRLHLKVEGGAGRAETELEAADGQWLLVDGLTGGDCSAERLYKGRPAPAESREVLVLLTPRVSRSAAEPSPSTASLTRP